MESVKGLFENPFSFFSFYFQSRNVSIMAAAAAAKWRNCIWFQAPRSDDFLDDVGEFWICPISYSWGAMIEFPYDQQALPKISSDPNWNTSQSNLFFHNLFSILFSDIWGQMGVG